MTHRARARASLGTCLLAASTLGLVAGGLLGGLAGAPARAQAADAARACAALQGFEADGVAITGAKIVEPIPPRTIRLVERGPEDVIEAAFPQHCRVEGTINRRTGADGKDYAIGFALALPGEWNGRLLFQGGGGFNGTVREPWGMNVAGDAPALTRGFAVVSTDSGHKGETFDVAFMRDQQASVDFAFNALHAVTLLAKQLVAAHYGRAPHHSYGVGCSTGGREGMVAAQRYPELFDGVIAGAPAMRTAHSRLAGWNATAAFNRIAPRDAAGTPLAAQAFSAADHAVLRDAVARQCDALDGLEDGLVMNIAACRFDPASVQCAPGQAAGCLGADKVAAVRTAFDGPRDGRGRAAYARFPYDLGLLGGRVPMTLIPAATGYSPFLDPPQPLDVDAALATLHADPLQALSDTYHWSDLGTFYRRGGKMLLYNGAADPWFSLYDTLDWFERNKARNPEFDSSRLYNVPGMQHCAGGGLERFDLLTALVDWVEHGRAPGPIMATDWRRQVGTRPLCPWPQYARYSGTGDPKDASSFRCVGE
jgi:feruloyl esterase